jgi:hypothetical protein
MRTEKEITPENYRIIRREDGSLAVYRRWKAFMTENLHSICIQNTTWHDVRWVLLDPEKHSKKINEVINSGKIPIISYREIPIKRISGWISNPKKTIIEFIGFAIVFGIIWIIGNGMK